MPVHREGSIVIACTPEDLYELVSDVTRMGGWSPVCKACWWDEGAGPRVGAVFTGRNELPERTWETRSEVVAGEALRPGRSEVEFRFDKDQGAGGRGELVQNDVVIGAAVVERFTPVAYNEVGIGLTCGYEWGPAVGRGYEAPFPFNGTIRRAVVETVGPPVHDPVAEVAAILSAQ